MAEMLNNNATTEQLPTAEETNLRQNEGQTAEQTENELENTAAAGENEASAGTGADSGAGGGDGSGGAAGAAGATGGGGSATADSNKTTPSREVKLINENIGENIILYGVPGCGKSHTIKKNFCSDENYIKRVVFHQDYTYSDFVGQILPESDASGSKISYPFKPGPFTEILRDAYHEIDEANKANEAKKNDNEMTDDNDSAIVEHKPHMYYLIIEEINRGNAPAIFGDLFQLLDRNDDGESVYGVQNADIAKVIYGDKEKDKPVKIPSNLTILATMNTADQNVFTLDTAFKRRWRMCSIKNDIEKCSHAERTICGTEVTWKAFVKSMNACITSNSEGGLSNEDKRLGAYFVRAADLNRVQLFAEKVLMYLWNDAFRYSRDKVFKPKYKTLEDLIDGFYDDGFGIFLQDAVDFDTAENNRVFDVIDSNELDSGAPSKGGSAPTVDTYLSTIKSKNQYLHDLYIELHNEVEKQIPDLFVYLTGNGHLCFKTKHWKGKNGTENFTVVDIQTSNKLLKVSVETYDSTNPKLSGLVTPITSTAYRNFAIQMSDNSILSDVVEAIVASYNALKL